MPGYSIPTHVASGVCYLRSVSSELTDNELRFIGSHVGPTDRAFCYGGVGAGALAALCKRTVVVEHDAARAVELIDAALDTFTVLASGTVSVVWAPADMPGGDDDLTTYRSFVQAYTGLGVDVVVIGGPAKVACARWVAERAPFGPHPSMRVFLLQADRPEYASIYTDTVVDEAIVPRCFDETERFERVALLKMREV